MSTTDGKSRLEALRRLLNQGDLSTQDELREKLERQDYVVTQSTISRDLRKLGAVKAVDSEGRTVYRLPDDVPSPLPVSSSSLRDMISEIDTNGTIIVIHTSPGSASLIARHLDEARPADILGTIAGDDTIFVAPSAKTSAKAAIKEILASFGGES